MKKLLKIKHWALFLLTIGIPIIVAIVMPFMTESAGSDVYIAMTLFTSLIMLTSWWCMSLLLGWFYAIGSRLRGYVPAGVRSAPNLKFFAWVPVIYVACIAVFTISATFKRGPYAQPAGDTVILNKVIMLTMVALHLFSMFCVFYCMYHAAKTLKAAELQRKVTFGDFAGEFFLMWFFPVGVWILQPRINKIVAEEPESNDMDIFSANPI